MTKLEKIKKESFTGMTIAEVERFIATKYDVYTYAERPSVKGLDGWTRLDSMYLVDIWSKKRSKHLGRFYIHPKILKQESDLEIKAVNSWNN